MQHTFTGCPKLSLFEESNWTNRLKETKPHSKVICQANNPVRDLTSRSKPRQKSLSSDVTRQQKSRYGAGRIKKSGSKIGWLGRKWAEQVESRQGRNWVTSPKNKRWRIRHEAQQSAKEWKPSCHLNHIVTRCAWLAEVRCADKSQLWHICSDCHNDGRGRGRYCSPLIWAKSHMPLWCMVGPSACKGIGIWPSAYQWSSLPWLASCSELHCSGTVGHAKGQSKGWADGAETSH